MSAPVAERNIRKHLNDVLRLSRVLAPVVLAQVLQQLVQAFVLGAEVV